jgi:hypothetical protein
MDADTLLLFGIPTEFSADFVGKNAGSTVANPNKAYRIGSTSLQPPSVFTLEMTTGYPYIAFLGDNQNAIDAVSNMGQYVQQLFSFDLIRIVERDYGYIGTTTADKVNWLKANLASITCNWWGWGSSATGNKAKITVWNVVSSAYSSFEVSHTSGSVLLLQRVIDSSGMSNVIDSNGFVHFLAHAEPSNGTVASTIRTDYVRLDVQLKG